MRFLFGKLVKQKFKSTLTVWRFGDINLISFCNTLRLTYTEVWSCKTASIQIHDMRCSHLTKIEFEIMIWQYTGQL